MSYSTCNYIIHDIVHVGVQQNILTACTESIVFTSFLETSEKIQCVDKINFHYRIYSFSLTPNPNKQFNHTNSLSKTAQTKKNLPWVHHIHVLDTVTRIIAYSFL